MNLFDYDEYKQCVNDWVKSQTKSGYGLYTKIANFLGTNSVMISQIFKGDRELNLEQAAKLTQFMKYGTLETDYFLLLVQKARAGSHDLKAVFERQLSEIRHRGQAIKNRIQHEQLSDQDKAIFYSAWYFIAIWLSAPIPKLSSVSELSRHLQIPQEVVSDVLRFLLDRGLLVKKSGGDKFDFGSHVVHVPHDSPFVIKHHSNWRLKALQAMDQKKSENLHYTAPMSLSTDLVKQTREELVQFVQKQTKRVATSQSEQLMCLNIDWFQF